MSNSKPLKQHRQHAHWLSTVAVMLILALGLASCGTGLKEDTVKNKSPAQLVKEMHDMIGQIVGLHGGEWTYNDGETPWQEEATEGYNAQDSCPQEQASRFETSLLGPPVDSPEAAVAKIKEHFLDQGFTIVNQFDSKVEAGRYIVFAMAAENEASFTYQAGTHASGLSIESECSTHPDMNETTK